MKTGIHIITDFLPLIVVFISVISKKILLRLAYLEKRLSRSERTASSAENMFILSFINVGLVIFAVNLKIESLNDSLLIFSGEFGSFSNEWYHEVGSTVVASVFLLVLSGHIENLSF